MPDPNQNPNNGGQQDEAKDKKDIEPKPDQTKDKGTATDPKDMPSPKENLKGKKDEQGIPLDPDERADFYKDKFVDSSRGANTLLEKNKVLEEENNQLKDTNPDDQPIVTPKPEQKPYTAEDLKKSIPGWNNLNIEQQTAILNSYGAMQKDLDSIKETVAGIVDTQAYQTNFTKLVNQPEFSKIAERKEKFREYAYREEHLNTPLDVLAKAFIVDEGLIETKPEPNPDPEQKPAAEDKNKDAGNEGLESGSGGSKNPSSNKEGFTTEEAAKMRKEDPKKYNRLSREGKMKIIDEE